MIFNLALKFYFSIKDLFYFEEINQKLEKLK